MNVDDVITLTGESSGIRIDMRCCLFLIVDRYETGTPRTLQLIREKIDKIYINPHGPKPEFICGLLPEECIMEF